MPDPSMVLTPSYRKMPLTRPVTLNQICEGCYSGLSPEVGSFPSRGSVSLWASRKAAMGFID